MTLFSSNAIKTAALFVALMRGGVQAQKATLPPPATRRVDFVTEIQPLLEKHCYSCHGPEKQKSDLRWDSKASVFKNGEHGPVLVAGNSARSRGIRLVAGLEPVSGKPAKG